jgi:hypothetical protein
MNGCRKRRERGTGIKIVVLESVCPIETIAVMVDSRPKCQCLGGLMYSLVRLGSHPPRNRAIPCTIVNTILIMLCKRKESKGAAVREPMTNV